MQNYPNYLMNNNMPMYYQPLQNPYAERLAQMQQTYQQQMPVPVQGISGRIVEDFNAIVANDVPMDGFGAIFVKSDGSEIQRRVWTKDGTIATTRFKAQIDDLSAQTIKVSSEEEKLKFDDFKAIILDVQDNVRALHDRLDKMNKANRVKKEVSEDE